MGGSRFIVLRMSHIIRTAAIALIGLIIIIALVMVILPKGGKKTATAQATYNPGTYSSQIILYNSPVDVLVTVDENAIQTISMSEMEENAELFYPLFKPTLETLANKIIEKQTTNVMTTTETMYTGMILLEAVNNALARASVDIGE